MGKNCFSAYELYTQSISGEKRRKEPENQEIHNESDAEGTLDENQGKDAKSEDRQEVICKHFKSSFSRDVKVHFVGAW
jgi:hypothetical protein